MQPRRGLGDGRRRSEGLPRRQHGQAPSSAAQLAPYLADPANADLLQGFGKPDSTAPPGCLFQMSPGVDDWYGSTCYVADNDFQSRGTGPGITVEQAIVEYQRAKGAPPSDAAQIHSLPAGRRKPRPSRARCSRAFVHPSGGAPVITQYGGMVSISGSGESP